MYRPLVDVSPPVHHISWLFFHLTHYRSLVVDGQIAAIAEVNGLVLVTRNVRDFARFCNLEVEDWYHR